MLITQRKFVQEEGIEKNTDGKNSLHHQRILVAVLVMNEVCYTITAASPPCLTIHEVAGKDFTAPRGKFPCTVTLLAIRLGPGMCQTRGRDPK